MEIIPAIDIIEGRCVRLTGGDYAQKKVYNEDPVAVAKEFEQYGLNRLHLVDLDGAKAGGIVNHAVLSRIAGATSLTIDFGGGIKRNEDIRVAFESGAAMVTGGSVAVRDPELFLSWLERWGSDRLILGADVKAGFIAVSGWKEQSHERLIPFVLDYLGRGVRKVICTDISRDGMLSGSAQQLYGDMLQASREAGHPELELIASGGVTAVEELDQLACRGMAGAIIGKALYEGAITLESLARWVEEHQPAAGTGE